MAKRPAHWPNYAGLRAWRKNRETGNFVAVYDGEAQGMDTEGGRWQTVCDPHGTILNHETLKVAISWVSEAADWCEACRAEIERPPGCKCPVVFISLDGAYGVFDHLPTCKRETT